ncbi:hypothetical protein ACWGIU_27170 [Streptomyces sp. NPDC054840]
MSFPVVWKVLITGQCGCRWFESRPFGRRLIGVVLRLVFVGMSQPRPFGMRRVVPAVDGGEQSEIGVVRVTQVLRRTHSVLITLKKFSANADDVLAASRTGERRGRLVAGARHRCT